MGSLTSTNRHAPMLITGRLHDSRTGKAQLQVSWYHQDRAGSRWIAQIVQRSTVADAGRGGARGWARARELGQWA